MARSKSQALWLSTLKQTATLGLSFYVSVARRFDKKTMYQHSNIGAIMFVRKRKRDYYSARIERLETEHERFLAYLIIAFVFIH